MAGKIRIDMAGRRYGRLVGIECAHRDASGHLHWRFACDCGAETVAHGGNVRSGATTSCGCFHRETSAARLTVHGARAGKRHGATYRAWQQMNDSCANAASPGFPRHGALGVGVAPAWRSDYASFLADLGERPAGTALVRIDPDGDFAPGNCRWAPLADRSTRAAQGWQGRRPAASHPRAQRPSETPDRKPLHVRQSPAPSWAFVAPSAGSIETSQSIPSPAAAASIRASMPR